jgi:hypothetical protein
MERLKLLVAAEPLAIPLTVTHLLEHLYCPRFTYFEYVLGVSERQGNRPLVLKGRQVHEERRRTNPHYLRKSLASSVASSTYRWPRLLWAFAAPWTKC